MRPGPPPGVVDLTLLSLRTRSYDAMFVPVRHYGKTHPKDSLRSLGKARDLYNPATPLYLLTSRLSLINTRTPKNTEHDVDFQACAEADATAHEIVVNHSQIVPIAICFLKTI